MRVVYSPAHLGHEVRSQTQMGVQVPASEIAERAEVIRDALEADGGFELVAPTEHGEDPITAVHDPGLLAFLRDAWADTRRRRDPARVPRARDDRQRADDRGHVRRRPPRPAAHRGPLGLPGAGHLDADRRGDVCRVARGRRRRADRGRTSCWAGIRPPTGCAGRPATTPRARCTAATATSTTPRSRPRRSSRATGEPVAILDVDYHHGNGTEQIFWRRGDVLYVSLHAHPDREYPYYLGWPEETGEGPGEGANLNLPLPAGTTNAQYLEALDRGLERIADHGGSTLVVSLGFDTYGLDPLGDFALTTDVYHEVGRRAAATGKRLVILQEGGYYVPALGENARAWLRGAEGRP